MHAAAIVCWALLWGVPAVADDVPESVEGCWLPWPGERLTIRRTASGGLESRSHFDRELIEWQFWTRGPNRAGQRWLPVERVPGSPWFVLECGPTTQHGQFCRVRRKGDSLEVELWLRGHGPSQLARTRRSRTTLVERCTPDPGQVVLPPGVARPPANEPFRAWMHRVQRVIMDVSRACRGDGYECWCRRACARGMPPAGGLATWRIPLPGTNSGSTPDGSLVPLGPTFDITINEDGQVTACGTTGAVKSCAEHESAAGAPPAKPRNRRPSPASGRGN